MDILNIEIILRLVLSIFVILIPFGRLVKKYAHFLQTWFQELRNIQLQKPEWFDDIKKDLQNEFQPIGKEEISEKDKKSENDSDRQKDDDSYQISEPVSDIPKTSDIKEEQKTKEVETKINIQEKDAFEQNSDDIPGTDIKHKDISSKETTILSHQQKEQDKQKLQKKIEDIKYSALASKERGKKEIYEKKLIEGLALDPENIELLTLLSTHYFEEKKMVKSLSLLKKIINLHPENHKAIWQVGQIYLQQKELEKAQLLMEKAIKLKSDHPKYHITLVEIHYENQDLTKAIQTMETVLKLRPNNIDYLLTMATLYEEANKFKLAKKYYSKVLEISPGNAHAKKGLKRIA